MQNRTHSSEGRNSICEKGMQYAIPISALTANAFDSDRKKALKTGMNGYIAKPISTEKLMEIMREVLS